MEPDLIHRWAGEGLLPTFKRLLQTSSWGQVDNPIGLVSGSTWQTFWTGANPARHGLYNAYEYFDSNSYSVGYHERGDPNHIPFWEVLSRAGKRVAVIDTPYCFLSEELNGIHVVDWFTHTRFSNTPIQTQPKNLAKELERRFGADPLGLLPGSPCDLNPPRSKKELVEFRNALIGRIEAKSAFCKELLEQGNWDLFFPSFCECHCVGHHCWHIHEEGHARYDADIASEVGDPVRDVYIAIDRAVGRLIECAGPDATVLVYCSFGMTAGYTGTFLLDDMLQRLEGKRPNYLVQKSVGALREIWRSASNEVRDVLRPVRQGPWETFYRSRIEPDRATRRFFEVKANDATGGVRFNLIGRETHGLVSPGAEYDRLCDELADALMAFVKFETGEPLVREVLRTDRIYWGEQLDRLPDLLVQWRRETPILRVASPSTGVIQNRHRSMRSGDHTQSGLCFLARPDVVPNLHNRRIAVTDLAPTITSLLGVTMSSSDGKPIEWMAGLGPAQSD